MLSLVIAAKMAAPFLAHPIEWARDFAAPGDFCFAADIDGDGYADLIRVSPKGDAYIDVAVNKDGMKSLGPQRACSGWGHDCQAVTIGDFDGDHRADVLGIFGGQTLRLAHGFNGHFQDDAEWMKLPNKLEMPHLTDFVDSKTGEHKLLAWSEKTGEGYLIDVAKKLINPCKERPGTRWESRRYRMDARGRVFFEGARPREVGTMRPGHIPVALGPVVFLNGPAIADREQERLAVDEPGKGADAAVEALPKSGYPDDGPCVWAAGDMDKDGDADLVQFRFGPEPHSGHNVLLHRTISPGETDSDHDGLTNDEEAKLGTDPYNPDTDGDGLLDGWEVHGIRDLDLPKLGCDPRRIDVICLVSRFANLDKSMAENVMTRIQGYYTSLGWALHPIWLDQVADPDQKNAWWTNRDKFLPNKWRGIAHWMQITPGGGGQADQLGDGGGCAGNDWSLYATFIHEFGHQLGLSHEGFYAAAWCPTYPSMMNYAYSYGYDGDIKKIRYSDGALANYVLHETDLDESIPLPLDKVEFLSHAPYHYRLKAEGDHTLIDWNWNGVFGEKHVRADINYAYSTTAGRRDDAGKTQSAPWTFSDGKAGYVLFAQHDVKPDGKSDPSVSAEKPGRLMLRRLIKPFQWTEPIKLVDFGVTGDPVAVCYKRQIVVAFPSAKGIVVKRIRTEQDKVVPVFESVFADALGSPSLGVFGGNLFLFDWNPTSGAVRYRLLEGDAKLASPQALTASDGSAITSTIPVGAAEDTKQHQLILGLAQNQDKTRLSRWQVRRFRWDGKRLVAVLSPHTVPPPASPSSETAKPVAPAKAQTVMSDDIEWIEGEKGGSRGQSRCVVLYDDKGLTGMKGRTLYFGRGWVNSSAPWSCEYIAESIGDKTINGGWMVKRYYDEWTQSRSGPAACWFNGDILYAYRWADGGQGASDNTLHVSYNGTGIESVPMGDFDDIGFMKSWGIHNSILYLHE